MGVDAGTTADRIEPPRRRRSRGARLVLLSLLLWGCAAAPPAPPPAPGERPAAAPRPADGGPARAGVPASGAIRVLVEELREPVTFEAGVLRVWDASGRLLGEERRALEVSAQGGAVRWGRSAAPSIDLAGIPELRAGGKRLGGRVRLTARDGTLRVVAVAPFEAYVATVLAREAPASFRPEALKAIAVSVRTYAAGARARPRDRDYDLGSTVEDQVFDLGAASGGPPAEAAEATRGELLMYRGAPAQANFHAACGGRTESAAAAWGGADLPYLRSVACDDCRESPVWRWEHRMDEREARRVARALGIAASDDLAIEVTARTATGRAARMRISSDGVSREMQAALFRKTAGYGRVKSLAFEIRRVRDSFVILGEGYGHGVGLCQWGANGMAKAGKGYREILARYYRGTAVSGDGR